jgi:hypothetical protein
MNEKRRKTRLEFLSAPLETFGWHMNVAGVSLSNCAQTNAQHIGVILQPNGVPELTVHVFLTPDDAVFLRDGLDDVLKVYRSSQEGSN